jgi:tetratricopeptide (TPR) repeat protein
VIRVAVLALAQLTGWSGARPAECASLEGSAVGNVWERAKAPELRHYCDLLASGAAKLAGGAAGASQVLSVADEADRAIPGRAAPSVLRGRALARLGRYVEAMAALKEARARDERALDDPAALLTWARVLARSGRAAEAADAYRALLPRAGTLTPADRGAAAIEAGMLASARGPAGIEEAIAVLRQARQEAQDATQTVAVLALALALDRAGEREESRALLAARVHADPRGSLNDGRVRDMLAVAGTPAEADALEAIALEAIDPPGAREAWRRYVESSAGRGPWIEHARAHETGAAPRRASQSPQPPSPPARASR